MRVHFHRQSLTTHTDLRHFFRDSVNCALQNQGVEAEHSTILYVVNLLTTFAHAENLFEKSEEGVGLKPLAMHYRDALHSSSPCERRIALQRLGDCALFIAGIFSDSLERKAVDLDYYVSMGGNAYACLADIRERRINDAALGDIFAELAEKFVAFVDILNEVGEGLSRRSHSDLLRLYEVWLRTGSERARKRLREHGMEVTPEPNALKRH